MVQDPVSCVRYTLCTMAHNDINWRKQYPSEQRSKPPSLWWEDAPLPFANSEASNTQIVMLGLRNRTCSAGTSILSEVADE